MMDGIRQWLLGVLAAAMALSLLYALLPKGAVRGAARATGGLILLLVVLGRGASEISSTFGLNQSFSDILTGIILFFIIGSEFFITYRVSLRKGGKKEA